MRVLKNSIFLIFSKTINLVISFLMLPILSREFSVTDYGIYGQSLVVHSFFLAISAWGFGQFLYVVLEKEKGSQYFSHTLKLASVFGIILALLMAGFSTIIANWLGEPDLSIALKVFSISVVFSVVNTCLSSCYVYLNRTKQLIMIQASTNFIKVILILIAVYNEGSILSVIAVLTIIPVFQSVLMYFNQPLRIDFHDNVSEHYRYILKQASNIGFANVLGIGFVLIDSIMIMKILGTDVYALYRNGAIEIPVLSTIYLSVSSSVFSEISKLYEKRDISKIIELKKRVIRILAILIYPLVVFCIFNADSLIPMYLSDKYKESVFVFMIYSCLMFWRINDFQDVIIVSENGNKLIKNGILIILINLGLNFLLIPLIGMEGAALATLIANSVGFINMSLISSKILKVGLIEYWNLYLVGSVFLVCVLIFGILHSFDISFWFLPIELFVGYLIILTLGLKMKIVSVDELKVVGSRIPVIKKLFK